MYIYIYTHMSAYRVIQGLGFISGFFIFKISGVFGLGSSKIRESDNQLQVPLDQQHLFLNRTAWQCLTLGVNSNCHAKRPIKDLDPQTLIFKFLNVEFYKLRSKRLH